MTPLISLLTDFGVSDNYVGVMKGVMLNILPEVNFVDITHQIPPQAVREAAFSLFTALPYFPEDSVHLVVVDPGVGSSRRPIGVQTPRYRFIAPDNGVLSYALSLEKEFEVVELSNPAYQLAEISTTFHGRDIFSPAAAHLAAGVPLGEFGPDLEDIIRLPEPVLRMDPHQLSGEVLGIDHFGNIGTSINALRWVDEKTLELNPVWTGSSADLTGFQFSAAGVIIKLGELKIKGVSATFSSVEPGQPVAVVGSDRGLDLAVNQGNLAHDFGVEPGDRVTVLFE